MAVIKTKCLLAYNIDFVSHIYHRSPQSRRRNSEKPCPENLFFSSSLMTPKYGDAKWLCKDVFQEVHQVTGGIDLVSPSRDSPGG